MLSVSLVCWAMYVDSSSKSLGECIVCPMLCSISFRIKAMWSGLIFMELFMICKSTKNNCNGLEKIKNQQELIRTIASCLFFRLLHLKNLSDMAPYTHFFSSK